MHEALQVTRAHALGSLAAAALHASGGRFAPLAGFPDAPYRQAAGEIIWIGHAGPMHPRAVFVPAGSIPSAQRIEDHGIAPWLPDTGLLDTLAHARLVRSLAGLLPHLQSSLPSAGLGPLLAGRSPAFPLSARHTEALAVGRAALNGDTGGFEKAAVRLLGAGVGLTPSGDDFIGAILFGARLAPAGAAHWHACGTMLCVEARARTHAISAALFADLAAGASFSPLHSLVHAAADGAPPPLLMAHVGALTAIGHCSGWDMLTGLIAATVGLPRALNRHHSSPPP